MRNHPVVGVKYGLSAMALAALAVLAACGGEPAERLEVVAEFQQKENATHMQKLVSKFSDHKLVLGKSGDRHTLRAPATLAAELQPGLDRLITRLALDDEELPLEPQAGRPEARREYERRLEQDRIEKALRVDLRTRGVEFLSAHVELAKKSMSGNREGPYEHVGAIVLLPTTVAVGSVEADVRECLQRAIKTVSQAPSVRVELVDVQSYLLRPTTPIAPEVVVAGTPVPTAPLSPAETPPPSRAPAAAAPAMVASQPLPQLPAVGDGIVEVAEASPTPPNACPARPAPAAETAPTPVVQPPLEAKPHAPAPPASAEEARADAPADEPPTEPLATNEVPPAEPNHGAMWILYLVAMASLCGNVACVLVWWRARRRERERARLARLFAKVA